MRKIKWYIIFYTVFLSSCKKEDERDFSSYQPNFVVEGWIEEGGYPHVILTHNLPFFTKVDSAQLSEIVIRWAKVSVSDGTDTEILTSRKDDRYFPPFLYRGSQLKGEVGKVYTLTVEYAGHVLSAQTSIPNPVNIDTLW